MRTLLRTVARRLGMTPASTIPPLERQNAAEVARLSQQGEAIVFVSSYPRSGNTWLRYLLCDCLLQNIGIETTTESRSRVKAVIPGFQSCSLATRDATVTPGRLFLKTHADYHQAMTMSRCQPGANVKHIFLYRRPEDALVSYYHFCLHRDEPQAATTQEIDAFCLDQLPVWCAMSQSYLQAKATNPDAIFLLSYEQMLADPEPILTMLLTGLNIALDRIDVRRAIANMTFQNLQAAETTQKKPDQPLQSRFFRRGQSGGGQAELKPSTLAQIQAQTADILQQSEAVLRQQQSGF
ncbi:MAG: sulfotransferase domain-containing protein [Cyanobacteria bacterium P01_G01_bin.54]